jgi:hypothetical protein
MALFGFGKKKKEETKTAEVSKKTFLALNKRSFPRYLLRDLSTSLGDAIDASKKSLHIAASGLKEGDFLDVAIGEEKYEATVVRVDGSKVAVTLESSLAKGVIFEHMKRLHKGDVEPKKCVDLGQIEQEGELSVNRAIINLMLEIEDPNTNIEKFKENIEVLEELKEKILAMANSVEVAGRGRVEDVGSAVTRLGFEAVKRIVYQYITYEVSLSHTELKDFKDFELYNIFLGAVFKKLAPLFNFKDIKNEGQSLLTMSSVGAILISKECPKIAPFYNGVVRLYSYEMRKLEERECGHDFFEVNASYFLGSLGVFRYLYDGYVLANYMLLPHYCPKNLKISLSQRKLRFAYVTYLSLLAQKFLFAKDKNAGFIFFHRLKRLGFSLQEAKSWLDYLVENTNKKLQRVGIEKSIPKYEIPSQSLPLESYLGGGVYVNYFLGRWEEFDKKGERLALRFEDEEYAHLVLEKLINHESYSLLYKPFCVVPCDILEDDELPLAMFEGFDLVIFKNVDKLDRTLLKDFLKIWRDFEGKIVVTFSSESMLEYDNATLYEAIKEQIVDFPSYFQSAILHSKMVTQCCMRINAFFDKKMCSIEEFKEVESSMSSVYAKVFNGV